MGLFSKKNRKTEDFEEKEIEINEEINEENQEDSKHKRKTNNIRKIVMSTVTILFIAGAGYLSYTSLQNPESFNKRVNKAIEDCKNGDYITAISDLFSENTPTETTATHSVKSPAVSVEKASTFLTVKPSEKALNNAHKTLPSLNIKKNKAEKKTNSKKGEEVVVNLQKLSIPDKVKVEKADNGKIKVIFKTQEGQKDIEKIKKEIALLKKIINSSAKDKEIKKEILSEVNTKIMILKGVIKNQINEKISPIIDSINEIKKKENNNEQKLASFMSKIQDIEEKYKNTSNNIADINQQIKNIQSSLKNINQDTIKKLESLVTELNKKTKDLQKLNKQISKIKQVFQDNIKVNINLAKKIDNLKQKVLMLENKVNGIMAVKSATVTNPQSSNMSETKKLSKKDYINTFGFYYAGYSENEGENPIGYISDSRGKIYEVQIGDIINNRYKISDIKPLYIKIKDLKNGKYYILSYNI